MTIESAITERATVLRMSGRMDAESYVTFERIFSQTVAAGAVNMIADLGGLVYISSAGVGALVKALKLAQATGGEILLSGVHGLVKDVLTLTRIITLFRVFDTAEAALAAVR